LCDNSLFKHKGLRMTITYGGESHELPIEVLSRINDTLIVNIFDKQLALAKEDMVYDLFLNDTENGFPPGVDEMELDNSYVAGEDFYENVIHVVSCKDITPKDKDGSYHEYSNSFILEFKIKG